MLPVAHSGLSEMASLAALIRASGLRSLHAVCISSYSGLPETQQTEKTVIKWLLKFGLSLRFKTSKTEVLQTPSAIKSKPRSRGRVVKVFEFLKNIEFPKSFN